MMEYNKCWGCKHFFEEFDTCHKHYMSESDCNKDVEFEDRFADMIPLEEILSKLPECIGAQAFYSKEIESSFSRKGFPYYKMGYSIWRDDDDLCSFGSYSKFEAANKLYNYLVENEYIKS